MIFVTMIGVNEFEVVVEKPTETTHTVTLTPEHYQRLCGSTVTHEWLLIQAFRWLLEREPNTAIKARFDLAEISARFPEFEDALAQRIGR